MTDKMEKDVEHICDFLGIDSDSIMHLVLSNGWEVFAEVTDFSVNEFEDEEHDVSKVSVEFASDDEIVAYHPLRVIRDTVISDDGETFNSQSYFITYNAYSNNIYVPLNKNCIISKDFPDLPAKYEYLKQLEEQYAPKTVSKDDKKPSKKKADYKNVINLMDYRSKK